MIFVDEFSDHSRSFRVVENALVEGDPPILYASFEDEKDALAYIESLQETWKAAGTPNLRSLGVIVCTTCIVSEDYENWKTRTSRA